MPSPNTPRKSPVKQVKYDFPSLSPSLGLQPSHRSRPSSMRDSPGRRSPRKKRQATDRFIPNRQASWMGSQDWQSGSSVSSSSCLPAQRSATLPNDAFHLAEACGITTSRILEFQPAAPHSSNPLDLQSKFSSSRAPALVDISRSISNVPERILDAPGIVDDYYLNLLDWSPSNEVAIALEKSVYIWNANTGSVALLAEMPSDSYVCSVKWSQESHLSIGTSTGEVQVWDVQGSAKLRSMRGRTSRVGVMSWNQHIVSSGARDGGIWHHDVRVRDHAVAQLFGHDGEVCGLTWRGDGTQLASGANDNIVNIWDCRSSVPKFTKNTHKAAVKALAWCPWQRNILASGGGTQDKQIHFWNTATGSCINTIETDSQVTSLHWSTSHKEIVSTHGFPNNQLQVWSYSTMQKIASVDAHDSRILTAAISPDGQVLATCAADENLKFWKIFEPPTRKLGASSANSRDMTKSMFLR